MLSATPRTSKTTIRQAYKSPYIIAQITKAQSLMSMQQYEDAVNLLEIVIKKNSKRNSTITTEKQIDHALAPVYYLIGECYIRMQKLKKAKDFLIAAYWNALKSSAGQKENSQAEEEDDIALLYRHRAFCLLFKAEVS